MNFILGTAGHIDHGKSSLVRALTGIDPDRLPEEKKRGVTIELGFAHLSLDKHEIGIVDVPGHADFVNNMVSGVGALDIALFIVAADDAWMPQSEEHLHILSYLGIKNIIIALTKADLCEDIEFTTELVRDDLQGTILEEAPIIPVSSVTGMGLDELKQQILTMAATLKSDNKGQYPRLHVDRTFTPQGMGTVVTGTLLGGNLSTGDEMVCYPQMLQSSVRHIQTHKNKVETALPGSRTGINVPDLPLDTKGKPGVKRGSLLAPPDTLELTSTLDIHLKRMDRQITGQTATTRPLKNTETVILHIGTDRIKARVILNDRTQLDPGEECFAQLRLEHPAAVCTTDHFVLRDGAQQGTLGGGVVLSALGDTRGFRTEERAAGLQSRLENLTSARDLLINELELFSIRHIENPLPNSPFSKTFLKSTIQKLVKERKIFSKGDYIMQKAWWTEQLEAAGKLVKDWHKDYPDQPAMPIETWRAALKPLNIPSNAYQLIENTLLGGEFQKKDIGIAHEDHNLELPEHLVDTAEIITSELHKAGLHPPALVDLLDTNAKQQCMKFLIRSGAVTELSPKAVILSELFANTKAQVVKFIRNNERATSSDIREHINTTRKVLIPLLENMDEEGLTKRDGDFRLLGPNA